MSNVLEFVSLDKKDYEEFFNHHNQASFMQSVQLGNLKEELKETPHYVGVKRNGKIVAATLILEQSFFFNWKTFYAPRGFLIDYHDSELLSFFTENIKQYVKARNGFRIIIDPNVVYRVRNNDGSIMNDDNKDEDTFNNLIDLGYKHFGFNIYIETLQARWGYRLKLDCPYDELKKKFSKSTRKNIEMCYKKGLQVRKGSIDDLDSMTELFDSTARRKDFQSRSLDYYKKMYTHMKDLMNIYIAYIEPDAYIKSIEDNLAKEKINNLEIDKKMETAKVGHKLKTQKETSDKLIEKYELELIEAKAFKEKYPNGKDIAALLSLKSGNEYLTLSSGSLEEFRKFTPKYAMYDHHIKDAYAMGYEWIDFYGISGCFDKSDKFYGIYEFKKGFGGNVIELVGQFELKVTNVYNIYNLLKRIKRVLKK